ncbi:hypothetical protein BGW80DRAFT_1307321 [Lactifluus volemus]|nr:hypothetical protein BGW80DRAFT_1307321 [Lactifluus volemus]
MASPYFPTIRGPQLGGMLCPSLIVRLYYARLKCGSRSAGRHIIGGCSLTWLLLGLTRCGIVPVVSVFQM